MRGHEEEGTKKSATKARRHEGTKKNGVFTMLKVPSTLPQELEEFVYKTIGCGIAVHRGLGPGLLDSTSWSPTRSRSRSSLSISLRRSTTRSS